MSNACKSNRREEEGEGVESSVRWSEDPKERLEGDREPWSMGT